MSVNKVILVGNVGNDPEVQYVQTDVPVARFRIATNESYKDKSGQRVTNTEWHNVTVWRGLAKVVEQYVKKGSKLYIEGKITYRQYEKDGQTRYFTEIVARELTMLDSRPEGNDNKQSSNSNTVPSNNQQTSNSAPAVDDFSDVDDLPF